MKSLIWRALFVVAALSCGVTHTAARAQSFVVCIDPGHPSETSSGARANGLSENTLNWQVAIALAQRLQKRGIAVVLTKTSLNQRVTNRRRAEIANGANTYGVPCALFLRLHCDTGGGRGFAWYYPDRTGRKQGVSGPPLSVQRDSRRLAHVMNEAMKPVLRGQLRANSIKTDAATFVGGKQGGVLTGSIFSKVPTALIEMCFINQRSDARFIASQSGRSRMAQALEAGVLQWRRQR